MRGPSTSKSQRASIISSALFISDAESTVTFGPIDHVGCARACSHVILSISDTGVLRNGPPLAVRMSCATSEGRRPGFDAAGDPAAANELYEYFTERLNAEGVAHVATGRFGADMLVSLENDGPATFLLSHPWEYAVTTNPNAEADE